MKYGKLGAALLALATAACGATTQNREDDSGNTNWLKACESDAECGELSCLCGSCRTGCGAATDCSAEPADSCVGLPATLLPSPGPPQLLREHRDQDAQAVDLALGQDGSVTLAGGKGATVSDLATIYFNFWVTKLSPEAEELWTYQELQDTPDPARSVVLTVGRETVALSTLYDGHDTPVLRRIGENGELIGSRMSTPGFTTMREDGRGGFFATGSNWANDVVDVVRNPTVAWVGLFDPPSVSGSETPHWQQERYDLMGGISNILVASSDGRGNLVVGGSLGTSADSNASQPYLARLNHPGEVVWERSVSTAEVTHCDTTAVAMFPSGSSLAAIGCGPRWLRAFQPSGQIIWERRFASGVTALAGLEDGGYVVALGGGAAVLERYDASHRLYWAAQQEGCTAFTRLAVSNGAVVALAECQPGYSLSWYADP